MGGHEGAAAISFEVCPVIDDHELEALHASAFGETPGAVLWGDRLHRHSLFWITARHDGALGGFVNVLDDGGAHVIIMDTCVAPEVQGLGIGTGLVRQAAEEARRRGCIWLHADYEPHLVAFYEERCGLRPTSTGLMRLT